jgi:hypothetical protein
MKAASGMKIFAFLFVLTFSLALVSASHDYSLGDYTEKSAGTNRQGTGEGYVKADNGFVVVGLGLGAYDNNDYNEDELGPHILRPMIIYTRELYHDGTLGPEIAVSLGNKNAVERIIKLPSGYIMTGWGAGINAPNRYGNWKVDYLEVTGVKLGPNGSVSQPITLVNKTSTGTLDNRVSLNFGYAATLIRGVVYKGRMEKTNVGGRQILFNGLPLTNTNITNQTNQTNHTNSAPSLTLFNSSITAYEGNLIEIGLVASDADNDLINVTFSSPFNNNGRWQTTIGSAGFYIVNITATDGMASTTARVNVTVLPFINNTNMTNVTNQTNQTPTNNTNMTNVSNRAPVIRSITYTGREEGDTFRINVDAFDPDGDSLTFSCEEPFGSDCRWNTEDGDEGTYNIDVTVSDGKTSTTQEIRVKVREDEDADDGRDDDSDNYIRVGEFQDNDLALDNRLYYDEDASTISLNGEYGSESTAEYSKTNKVLNLVTLFLILILLAIIAIIATIMIKARE